MTQNEVLEKYYSRLETEGILKAVLLGIAAGFLCTFLITFITWFTPFNGMTLAVSIGEGVSWISIPVFYFTLFKPTDRDVAKRLDQLGLEERLLTMVAYQDEKDGIYALQRRDAVAALDKVDVRSIRLVISPVLIILLACSLCLSVSMAVLNVKTGGTHTSLVTPIDPDPDVTEPEPFVEQVYYTVTYRVVYTTDGMSFVDNIGGYVTGGNTQEVKAGEDALTVTAVADEGFGFVAWLDTLYDDTQNASRTDKAVNEDVTYTAVFMLSDNGGGGSGSGNSSGSGSSNGSGSGDTSGTGSGGGGASVDIQGNNKVIEGETYYRDVIAAYYEQAMQQLADGTLSDDMRAFIEQYYGIIQ